VGTTTKQKTTNKISVICLKNLKITINKTSIKQKMMGTPKNNPNNQNTTKKYIKQKINDKSKILQLIFLQKQLKNGNTQKQPRQPKHPQKTH
jgi:hypothetical protein